MWKARNFDSDVGQPVIFVKEKSTQLFTVRQRDDPRQVHPVIYSPPAQWSPASAITGGSII